MLRCFACDKPITAGVINSETLSIDPKGFAVVTEDGQRTEVGPECYKHIKKANDGYQPPKGGPKLYTA